MLYLLIKIKLDAINFTCTKKKNIFLLLFSLLLYFLLWFLINFFLLALCLFSLYNTSDNNIFFSSTFISLKCCLLMYISHFIHFFLLFFFFFLSVLWTLRSEWKNHWFFFLLILISLQSNLSERFYCTNKWIYTFFVICYIYHIIYNILSLRYHTDALFSNYIEIIFYLLVLVLFW